jgi:flavodoxin
MEIFAPEIMEPTLFQGLRFALFCLGDRAYGPQFCAAGRKLAVRLMQLGMHTICQVGCGDDNTPNGGVFADLDKWIQQELLPTAMTITITRTTTLTIRTNPTHHDHKHS